MFYMNVQKRRKTLMDIKIPDLNIDDVKEFRDKLPEITDDTNPKTGHLMMLAFRSRKAREICNRKLQSDLVVERAVIRGRNDWKDRWTDTIINNNVLQHIGSYTVRFTNPDNSGYTWVKAPPEAFGNFATVNPRDVLSAVALLMKENNEHLINLARNQDGSDMVRLSKTGTRFFSSMHKCQAKGSRIVDIDVDVEDKEINSIVRDLISPLPIWMVLYTTRGFHYLLDVTKPSDAEFYFHSKYGIKGYIQENLVNRMKVHIDFNEDPQPPIAGCLYYRDKGIPRWVEIV